MLSPEVVAFYRLRRLHEATAEAVSRRGYRETTVADIARAARVGRSSFYEVFPSKQAAFMALLEHASADLLEAVETSCRDAPASARERVVAGVEAALTWVADRPDMAQCLFFDAPAGGARAAELQSQLLNALATALRDAVSPGAGRSALTEELLVGGAVTSVRLLLVGGRADSALSLGPQLIRLLDLAYGFGVDPGVSHP